MMCRGIGVSELRLISSSRVNRSLLVCMDEEGAWLNF